MFTLQQMEGSPICHVGLHTVYFDTKRIFEQVGFSTMAFFGKNKDIVMAFSPPEYCRFFAKEKAYKEGSRAAEDPPSYALSLHNSTFCCSSSSLSYLGALATTTATRTRTPQNNTFDKQKQFLCRYQQNNNVKLPNSRFFVERGHTKVKFSFSLPT